MPDTETPDLAANKILYWILGALLAIIMAGGSFWLNYVAAQVDDLRAEQKSDSAERAVMKERAAKVETKLDMVIDTTRNTNEEIRALRQVIERTRDERPSLR